MKNYKTSGRVHTFEVHGRKCTVTHEPRNGSGVQCIWEPPMPSGEFRASWHSMGVFKSEMDWFREQVAKDLLSAC